MAVGTCAEEAEDFGEAELSGFFAVSDAQPAIITKTPSMKTQDPIFVFAVTATSNLAKSRV